MKRVTVLVASCAVLLMASPVVVLAHGLNGRLEPPLPLVVYLIGAGLAVALSFAFVVVREVRVTIPPPAASQVVSHSLVVGLRALGLLGWLWIAAQVSVGGSSTANVASLFLWVYGWVGLAMLSAFVGPVWTWLDPFATLFALGASAARWMGLRWQPAPYPARLGHWPAVLGLTFFVWLELVYSGGNVGPIMLGYTALTLVAMARFGPDTWRAQGETFSVWFSTLGRLAPFALVGKPGSSVVRRRPALTGLLSGTWTTSLVVLVAIGTASILYDGLSQSQTWYAAFGFPALPIATLLLLIVLGGIVALVLAVTGLVGVTAMGAGLLPIAVGYLLAHYLTYLLGDGQRIVVAISDPLQLGWNLFGTASFAPSTAWLAPSLVWSFQLAAVVGGHVVGAWAGHVVAGRSRQRLRGYRLRLLPLAIVMVGFTATTLWSLGQATARP